MQTVQLVDGFASKPHNSILLIFQERQNILDSVLCIPSHLNKCLRFELYKGLKHAE